MLEFVKYIRDPIHNYIGLTDIEVKVLDHPLLQRLRHVQQLSFVDYVYPGGKHTRLNHSLGVMHLAGQAADTLRKYINLSEKEFEEFWQLFRLCGLLHDIGHGPFSHASEPEIAKYALGKDISDWEDAHVSWGLRIITDNKFGLSQVLGKQRTSRITSVLSGQVKLKHFSLANALLNGIISVDRLDYLQRDARHTGTLEYGVVDSTRIIQTACIHQGRLVFQSKGVDALDAAIMAYFYMYRALYYHHTVRGIYSLFQRCLKDAFDDSDNVLSNKNFLPEEFQKFTDGICLNHMLSRPTKTYGRLTKELLLRRTPKVILGERELAEDVTLVIKLSGAAQELPMKWIFEDRLKKKLQKRNYKVQYVLVDAPVLVPYPVPYQSYIGGAPTEPLIKFPDEEVVELSKVASHLTGLWGMIKPIPRVYIAPEDRPKSKRKLSKLKSVLRDCLQEALEA